MTILATTVVDTAAQTITLTITQASNVIESITYTKSSNTLLFNTVNAFSISSADYLVFSAILDTFNAAIFAAFNPATNIVNTFNISQVSDINDGISTLSFSFYRTNHALYSITATYPNGLCAFAKRNQATMLYLNEWLYFHASSINYELEIRRFFNL
jgi:hypothetical protein